MARDKIHDAVKQALIKDGWKITHDPYEVVFEDVKVFADLAAQRPFAAQKDDEKIAVEIKSFIGHSAIHDLSKALGQYIMYRTYIMANEPDRKLFLAVSEFVWKRFLG